MPSRKRQSSIAPSYVSPSGSQMVGFIPATTWVDTQSLCCSQKRAVGCFKSLNLTRLPEMSGVTVRASWFRTRIQILLVEICFF